MLIEVITRVAGTRDSCPLRGVDTWRGTRTRGGNA